MRKHLRSTKFRHLRTAIAIGVGVAVSCMSIASAQADPELSIEHSVGEVSLVLGKAFIVSQGEKPRLLKAGMLIGVNDQILTEANGHVHVRFVDDALVSVRPDSRLEIMNYEYNAANPERSSVKLNLLEGVTRAISGDAAKSARDRFRMNTPIAAIGVRGTDFVVSASEQSVRALVNEGAIVMAPYSSDCLQDAFGPCAVNGVELTQSAMQAVEIADESTAPRLVQISADGASFEDDRQALEVAESEVESEEVRSEEVEVVSENAASERIFTASLMTDVSPDPDIIEEPVDFTPTEPVPIEVLDERQLVWGRWSEGLAATERITVSRAEAEAGGERELFQTILDGRNFAIGYYSLIDSYSLYRPAGASERPNQDLTVVSFALDSAQAFYHSASGIAAMAVNDGSLEMDFVSNSFATELSLSSDITGALGFSANGRIQDNGAFFNDSRSIVGATSLDGAEAGYFFTKDHEDGRVEGLTLWDAQ